MVIKILSSAATFAGVSYNTNKIDRDKGELMRVSGFGPLQALGKLRPEDYINYLKIKIDTIDAKLSLRYNRGGKAELLLHPVYKEAVYPEYLTDVEAEKLQKGTAVNIEKVIIKDGKKVDALIEYDPDTKEFIITDTAKVMAPDLINNEYLSPEQKQRFKKGKEVEISDGTAFQYTANDVQGIRSNKLALVASLIIDAGITYMLYAGLTAMNNKLRDETLAGQYSAGYNDAIAELFKNQEKSDFWNQSDIADDKRQMKR